MAPLSHQLQPLRAIDSAGTHPEKVSLVNGELPWIALGLADLD